MHDSYEYHHHTRRHDAEIWAWEELVINLNVIISFLLPQCSATRVRPPNDVYDRKSSVETIRNIRLMNKAFMKRTYLMDVSRLFTFKFDPRIKDHLLKFEKQQIVIEEDDEDHLEFPSDMFGPQTYLLEGPCVGNYNIGKCLYLEYLDVTTLMPDTLDLSGLKCLRQAYLKDYVAGGREINLTLPPNVEILRLSSMRFPQYSIDLREMEYLTEMILFHINLDAFKCDASGFIEDAPVLKSLNLSHCERNGTAWLRNVFSSRTLKYLKILHPQFILQYWDHFRPHRSTLQELILEDIETDSCKLDLGNLEELKRLTLISVPLHLLDTSSSQVVRSPPRLESIIVKYCRQNVDSPNDYSGLFVSPYLESIYVESSSFHVGLVILDDLTSLDKLVMISCDMPLFMTEDNGGVKFPVCHASYIAIQLPSYEKIYLSDFTNCTKLKELYIRVILADFIAIPKTCHTLSLECDRFASLSGHENLKHLTLNFVRSRRAKKAVLKSFLEASPFLALETLETNIGDTSIIHELASGGNLKEMYLNECCTNGISNLDLSSSQYRNLEYLWIDRDIPIDHHPDLEIDIEEDEAEVLAMQNRDDECGSSQLTIPSGTDSQNNEEVHETSAEPLESPPQDTEE